MRFRNFALALGLALSLASPASAEFTLVGTFSAVTTSQDIPIRMPLWARGVLVTVRRTSASTGTIYPAIVADDGAGGGVFQISASLTTIDFATTPDGRWIIHQEPGSHSGNIVGHTQTRFPNDCILRLILAGSSGANFTVRVDWIR